jgi:hypothetical protein
VLEERLTAQLLGGAPAQTPEQVVRRLLAVQAQELRGARLAVRARSRGLTVADVDAAFTHRRSMVVTWLNRGTLHLVPAEDYWWLHPLTAPRMQSGVDRRLAQLGVRPDQVERAVDVVVEQVTTLGPRSREQLRDALDAAGVPTEGQALVHLLATASLRGRVVRGPFLDGEHCYAAVADWLGPAPTPLERRDALALLARRYLAGHGPADARDLAKWAGIGLGDARSGLSSIEDELVVRPDGLLDLAGRAPAAGLPAPVLLGPYDPLLHGWTSHELVTGRHRGIVTTNGLFRPFALVEGRAVATWGLSAGRLTIRLLETVPTEQVDALVADAAEVLRFLELPDRPAAVEPQT